jgi:multicomponent Na+:H+ antiporter subunit F
MKTACILMVCVLMLTLGFGLIRVVRGPTPADRMVAAMLFGTTGVAIVALLAGALQEAFLIDVALVFAVLAAISMVAFVRDTWTPSSSGGSNRADA